jgi:hypothetical protein
MYNYYKRVVLYISDTTKMVKRQDKAVTSFKLLSRYSLKGVRRIYAKWVPCHQAKASFRASNEV